MDINEFIKMNSAEKSSRPSVLKPYQDDIFRLKDEGFSGSKILEYLTLNGVKVTLTSLNRYIQRNYPAHTGKGKVANAQSAVAKKLVKSDPPPAAPAAKSDDPNKPSWVPDHIDIDALMRKD